MKEGRKKGRRRMPPHSPVSLNAGDVLEEGRKEGRKEGRNE